MGTDVEFFYCGGAVEGVDEANPGAMVETASHEFDG